MTYVYLLTVQGLTKGTGEWYSVVGIYSSKQKAKDALAVAEDIIGEDNLFSETMEGIHTGAELTIRAVELDKVYHIEKSDDIISTDMLIGGVIVF